MEALMGYVYAMGECIACGGIFTFNPMCVPSIRIKGEREPICKVCIERINVLRKEKGFEPIVPLPDAYEECDESELG